MKNILLILLLSLSIAELSAQTIKIPDFPDTGEELNKYPSVEWLKGNPVSDFDPGKTYIVELWATWCVPCIAAMPHIAELNKKFKDKGIIFIAQNVMDYDRQKVVNFVKSKAELADLNVGFAGMQGNDFEQGWVKGAGVNGIPQTFIIQGNRLMWQTTPYALNEKVLQLLVDHQFSIDAAKSLNMKTE
ncbi:TlpA disulfide reductase family protein [Pedobacter sp. AW31-3R]|uniref:TlpA disulfide reductase family protein n=1 Tax=Pedobacter sp. AW31-3R TaxID=3445781 RepID=UPI003F9FDD72